MSFNLKIWLQDLLRPLVLEAVKTAVDEANTKIQEDLNALNELLTGLPARIIGDAEKDVNALLHDVVGTTDDIAGKVKLEVSPLFSILDPAALAKNIVNGMTGGGQKPPWWPF